MRFEYALSKQMGPEVIAKDPQSAVSALTRPLPAELVAFALIDAQTCAAAGGMSVSWWNEEVRLGRAPAPAIRRTRCTRWRLADVQAFWRAFGADGDPEAAARTSAIAAKASRAAQAKRQAAAGDRS